MKVEELTLTITRIEDSTDKDGNVCLKCKGYNSYGKGRQKGFNFFSSIRLYPITQLQLDETKNRLFSQVDEKPKLKIKAYQSELVTPLIGGKIMPTLIVYRFDFAHKKLYKKQEILNYGKENK
jgi:hypothetical protein